MKILNRKKINSLFLLVLLICLFLTSCLSSKKYSYLHKVYYSRNLGGYLVSERIDDEICYGVYSLFGKPVLDCKYGWVSQRLNDKFVVKDHNDKYGVVNSDGVYLIPPEYEYVSGYDYNKNNPYFECSVLPIKYSLVILYDLDGKFISYKYKYEKISEEEFYSKKVELTKVLEQENKLKEKYGEKIENFNDKYVVSVDDKYGVVNLDGSFLVQPEYKSISSYNNGGKNPYFECYIGSYAEGLAVQYDLNGDFISYVYKHDKISTEEALAKKYEIEKAEKVKQKEELLKKDFYISDKYAGRYIVCKKNKYGVVNLDGESVIPMDYEFISFGDKENGNKTFKCYISSISDGLSVLNDLDGNFISYEYIYNGHKYEKITKDDVLAIKRRLDNKANPQNISSSQEEDKIELTGKWSYSMNYDNKKINLKGAKIENNNSYISGPITIKVRATKDEYTGGTINGYVLCEVTFNPLESGYYYYDIDKNLTLNMPPDGNYYLCVYAFHDGYITDYLNFPGTVYMYTPKTIPEYEVPTYEIPTYEVPSYSTQTPTYTTPYQTTPQTTPKNNYPQEVYEECSFCKGTGYNLFPEYGPQYSTEKPLMRAGERCDAYPYCSERVYSHYHKRCPSCGGKGKVKRLKWY